MMNYPILRRIVPAMSDHITAGHPLSPKQIFMRIDDICFPFWIIETAMEPGGHREDAVL